MGTLGFANMKSLFAAVEALPHVPWKAVNVQVRGVRGIPAGTVPDQTMYYRDPLDCLLSMYSDPFWKGKVSYDYHKREVNGERAYSELVDTDKYLAMQKQLPHQV